MRVGEVETGLFVVGRARQGAALVRQAVGGSDDLPIAVCDAGLVSVARQNSEVGEVVVALSLERSSYSGRVRFEVLGRLRVIDGRERGDDEGGGVRLGGARQQLVLAMLLAESNEVVSTDALVDGLWGDSPPSAARHTVQGYVSELRKVLGTMIEREAGGYVVRVDASSLDSFEFESLVSRGRAALVDDPEAAVAWLPRCSGDVAGRTFHRS